MKRGIAFRLSASVLSAVGIIVGLMSVAEYYLSREALLRNAEENARTLAQALVQKIESRLAPIPRVPRGLAYELEDGLLGPEDILRRHRQMLADNDEIFGMAVAFEPPDGTSHDAPPAHYTFRSPPGYKSVPLGGPGYRYHHMDWYQIPRELARTVWTEPYFDEGGGNILMTTCSVPFQCPAEDRTRGRSVGGVVTADVSLEWLKHLMGSVKVLDSGYAYLITGTGTYVTHPAPGIAYNETIFSRAEEHGDAELRRLGQSMIRGDSGFVASKSLHTGKPGFLVYAPLRTTGWSLAVFYPKDELLADVSRQAMVAAGLGGCGFLFLALLVGGIARSITRPLRRLAGVAQAVSRGDLDAPLPVLRVQDEVSDLCKALGHMQSSLKEYIQELTAATASRERMESELRIARNIQMSILPKLFPPLPDRSEIDLYARLEPAREVGGDFYDFFLCGRNSFCFLVGDVSGKGVPAAFYMAVAKTLIKALADSLNQQTGGAPDPGDILSRTNDDLVQDNQSCMFVTIFLGIIDMRSGLVRYASAGHNPPVLLRQGKRPSLLTSRNDPLAGVIPDIAYSTESLRLAPGDALLLYTDGVTEAMNPESQFFGDERLLDLASRLTEASVNHDARSVCQGIAEAVSDFAAGAEQSDDITLLTLRYQGPDEPRS